MALLLHSENYATYFLTLIHFTTTCRHSVSVYVFRILTNNFWSILFTTAFQFDYVNIRKIQKKTENEYKSHATVTAYKETWAKRLAGPVLLACKCR